MNVAATLAELPPPPPGKKGWPWTEETPLMAVPEGVPAPKISIVTPSYMQGRYLEETIRSVLLQGYPNLEYVVMDGGSRDETVDILQKYAPWLTGWASEKDAGQTSAINKGLKCTTGEIVAYINSDDWYHPGAFQAVARRAMEHPGEQWWVGDVDHRTEGEPPQRKQSCITGLVEFLGRTEVLQQPGVFWKRSLGESVGFFDESKHFIFDHEYFVRMVLLGERPVNLSVPIANFRIHGGSKTYSKHYRFMYELREDTSRYQNRVTPEQWREIMKRFRDHEAHYFVQSVYGALEQGNRLAAIGYLVRSFPLMFRISPRKVYFGAWARALVTGKPPRWFGKS